MSKLAENRRARFDYEVLETFDAGIELLGFEVKSVKAGRMGLAGSYAVFSGGQLFLLNAQIPPYQTGNTPEGYDASRSRRLLFHKSELARLHGLLEQKTFTLVPLEAFSNRGLVKIRLGLARSRKAKDKREYIKKRIHHREMRADT